MTMEAHFWPWRLTLGHARMFILDLEAHPGAMEAHHGAMEAQPRTLEANPGEEAHHGA